ncbi:MAG: enoyl-CoA hydratase-related protein [Bacteroidales bacterium]
MKTFQTIAIETINDIQYIFLNRPEVKNAFNDKMIEELNQVLGDIQDDPKVKALVIQGNGSVFSAGADLNWIKKAVNYAYEENRKDSEEGQEGMKALLEKRKPRWLENQ